MTPRKRRSSRKRMDGRSKGHRNGPTVLFNTEVPPKPIAVNRCARRFYKKAATPDPRRLPPIKNAGRDKADKIVYLRGDQRFIPPYLWPRVKTKKPKGKAA